MNELLRELAVTLLLLFTIIPVIPVILYHVVKGIVDDARSLKRRNRA